MTFRSPDLSKARHRRESGGWDSPSQRERVEKWFAERNLPQPNTPAECWEFITNSLLDELRIDETQSNLNTGFTKGASK